MHIFELAVPYSRVTTLCKLTALMSETSQFQLIGETISGHVNIHINTMSHCITHWIESCLSHYIRPILPHCIKPAWLTGCWVFFLPCLPDQTHGEELTCHTLLSSRELCFQSVNQHIDLWTCGGILSVMVSEGWLGLVAHVWLLPKALKRRQQDPHNTGLNNNNQHTEALKRHAWLLYTGNQAWNDASKGRTSKVWYVFV